MFELNSKGRVEFFYSNDDVWKIISGKGLRHSLLKKNDLQKEPKVVNMAENEWTSNDR